MSIQTDTLYNSIPLQVSHVCIVFSLGLMFYKCHVSQSDNKIEFHHVNFN